MRWLTKLLWQVLQVVAGSLLFLAAFVCFIAIAIFLRPLLMGGLVLGAIVCAILSCFSPRFRQWLEVPATTSPPHR